MCTFLFQTGKIVYPHVIEKFVKCLLRNKRCIKQCKLVIELMLKYYIVTRALP